MARIVFIGAGSFTFTRNLVRDILTFPLLENSTIVLVDINKQRLAWSKTAAENLVMRKGVKARIEATTDRKVALRGADVVICTILSGDMSVWRHDIEIPKKYGIDINIGDTRGPAGIFRALRTIPVMLDICRDIERLCPNAIFLNYTNPMAMLCMAMQKTSAIKVTGLCHSVQGTAAMLAEWIGAPENEITYKCAGINHQAWYLDYRWRGKDAYSLIRKAVEKRSIYKKEIVRNEMFRQLGYYVTESSGHNSEYNWWFRKRQDLIEKYCLRGTNWNPGEYAFIIKYYIEMEKDWKRQVRADAADRKFPLERGHEYAAYIINAYVGGEPYEFNGNVLNNGLITNLSDEACVEIPVFVNKTGFNPVKVGALPPQLAALNSINAQSEIMAVDGALKGDAELVFYAIAYDPLTASVLSLAEIRKMVNEMLSRNKPYLKNFKRFEI